MIPLSEIQIDKSEVKRLSKHTWHLDSSGYVRRFIPRADRKFSDIVYLHHEILPKVQGMEVDHINADKLDNRRCNLRYATKSQNAINRPCTKRSKTNYKGVFIVKDKYTVAIKINGKKKHLGTFQDIREAAHAYNFAAIRWYGSYAKLNEV